MKLKFKFTTYLSLGIVASFLFMAFSYSGNLDNGWLDTEESAKAKLWDGYKSWYKITNTKPNTGDPTGFLDGKHMGTKAFREVYINSVGEATHKGSAPYKYPAGTVVVKEQYKNEKKYNKGKIGGLTIMVKLEEGASPETGDWGYILPSLFGAKMSTGTGKTAKFCGNCHLFAAGNDYLFMNGDFVRSHP